MSAFHLTRREWLRLSSLGVAASSLSGWLTALAAEAAHSPARKRSCILLWMPGGPTQTDTFDMKPGHPNGGSFKPIDTSVSGLQISEHLPQLSKQMHHAAVIRSMQTKEGDHVRAAHHLRTGYRPQGPVNYPTLGSLLSNELKRDELELPGYVNIMPSGFLGYDSPGFLGPQRAPLVVGRNGVPRVQNEKQPEFGAPLAVQDIALPQNVELAQADARLGLLQEMEQSFAAVHPGLAANSHRQAYDQAVRMMRSKAVEAFDLDKEPVELRERYGKTRFGQGCLLARRLVEQGVPFVEVSLSDVEGGGGIGWDTHSNNFNSVQSLCGVLDPAWATLLDDLNERGLLETTLVVWMGEFGRTPQINGSGGRDHFPNAWSTVLCGGGIRGGSTYGATSSSGNEVTDNPVSVSNLLATVCRALEIDPTRQNISNVGRPIRIVEPEAQPIVEILA
jgi:hypothetical protein